MVNRHKPIVGAQTLSQCGHLGNPSLIGPYVIDTTGARHGVSGSGALPCTGTRNFSGTTVDGSGYTLVITGYWATGKNGSALLYDKSGNAVNISGTTTPWSITDPDGATITATTGNPILYTDSLGQPVMKFNGATYEYTDTNGNNQSYTITGVVNNWVTNFACAGINDSNYSSWFAPPVSITTPTGASYALSYEQTPGHASGNITGRLAKITYPSGGSVSYAYSGGNNGINCSSGVVPVLTITRNDNNGHIDKWTYVNSNSSSTPGNFTVTETDPANNQTIYSFSGEYQTQMATYEGGCPTSKLGCNGGGTLQRTTTTCYNANFSSCATPGTVPSPTISQTDVYTSINGSSSNLVETKYDSYGNTTEVKQYDFGATTPPTGNPLSDTSITHAGVNGATCGTVAPNQYDRPCSITTLNPSGSTMVQVNQVNYTYSNGHPTQTSYWVSGSTFRNASATYGSNGTISTFTDIRGVVSSYAYNGTGGCNGLLPTSLTVGELTASEQWNCNGGVLTQTTDFNGNPTSHVYNDPLWRVSSVTDALGNVTNITYTTTSVEGKLSFGSSTQDTITTVDGLGRTIRTQTKHGSAYDTVTTKYTPAAGTVSVSIPCSAPLNGDCTTGFTVVTKDADGRTSSIVDGGGATLATIFSAQETIATLSPPPTGENSKIIHSQTDGLGRTVSNCPILSSGGSSCGQVGSGSGISTAFGYSSVAGGTTATATRGVQTRSTVKDGLGRHISTTDPERGTTNMFMTTTLRERVWLYNAAGTTHCRHTPKHQ